jgi:hypothetical protein
MAKAAASLPAVVVNANRRFESFPSSPTSIEKDRGTDL